MAIDPKQIEDWKALVRIVRTVQAEGGPGMDDESLPVAAANAIEALLAERAAMLADAAKLAETLKDQALKESGVPEEIMLVRSGSKLVATNVRTGQSASLLLPVIALVPPSTET